MHMRRRESTWTRPRRTETATIQWGLALTRDPSIAGLRGEHAARTPHRTSVEAVWGGGELGLWVVASRLQQALSKPAHAPRKWTGGDPPACAADSEVRTNARNPFVLCRRLEMSDLPSPPSKNLDPFPAAWNAATAQSRAVAMGQYGGFTDRFCERAFSAKIHGGRSRMDIRIFVERHGQLPAQAEAGSRPTGLSPECPDPCFIFAAPRPCHRPAHPVRPASPQMNSAAALLLHLISRAACPRMCPSPVAAHPAQQPKRLPVAVLGAIAMSVSPCILDRRRMTLARSSRPPAHLTSHLARRAQAQFRDAYQIWPLRRFQNSHLTVTAERELLGMSVTSDFTEMVVPDIRKGSIPREDDSFAAMPSRLFSVTLTLFNGLKESLLEYIAFEYASPMDLVHLGRVSQAARSIVVNPRRSTMSILPMAPESCWASARARMFKLPPPPVVSVGGIWNESAYAEFLFGQTPCVECDTRCGGLPSCFALRFRCCESCKRTDSLHLKLRHWTAYTAGLTRYQNLDMTSWLPRSCAANFILPSVVEAQTEEFEQAVQVDSGTDIPYPKFVKRTTSELSKQWALRKVDWNAILKSHHDIGNWTRTEEYRAAAKMAKQRTDKILLALCNGRGWDVSSLLNAPTVRKISAVFIRDLDAVDWNSLQSAIGMIEREVRWIYTSRESFKNEQHTALKHRISQKAATTQIRCSECPQNTSL
ncbi:hypothetical protein DFH06DRAFT_1366200 [Mycena polygramma]|nr:hypothetical protein DFH06DRAFT_1366200 [Mycena polygramma]